MIAFRPRVNAFAPAIIRLSALSPLDGLAYELLTTAMTRPRIVPPRRELLRDGTEIKEALLIVDGWGARVRQLADGRRQIINFILPGDLIGVCDHERPLAISSITAMTSVVVCPAPERGISAMLDQAYATSKAIEDFYFLAQITRLGRMNAYERIADLFLELVERLELAGLADNGHCGMPLTQELIADALGLTPVHVNRTLQQARRAGELSWSARELVLHDVQALRSQVGRQPPRVSGR